MINHQKWLSDDLRYWWTRELLRDLAKQDINTYHRFLWSNHLAYALSYEIDQRFGKENIEKSRQMFFCDLKSHLTTVGFNPFNDIRSVFEVGCSLGYQLRYLETDLFPAANVLEGIDIDRYAILKGNGYLKNAGSKINLICHDMEDLNALLKGRIYDLFICTGTLMYLGEKEATRIVETMLQHTRIMVALSGPAHPDLDNSHLGSSVIRERDGSYIHNIDSMVKKSGGNIFARRWEGDHIVDGHTIYFVFATRACKTNGLENPTLDK